MLKVLGLMKQYGVANMKKIFLFFITVFLMSFIVGSFVRVEASTSVTYDVDGIFDTSGTWDGLSGTNTRGNTLSFDISSKPAGHDFAFWIINGVVRKDLAVDHEYVFTSVNILQIVFTPTDKVAAVFIDSNGRYLGVKYTEGGSVDDTGLIVPVARPGFVVSSTNKWTSIEGSASISDVQLNSVFVLTYEESETPLSDVTLSVTGGTSSVANPVPFNSLVTVTADAAPAEQVFAGWKENGRIVSYNSEYQFSALYNRTLVATYAASVTARPLVVMSNDLGLRSGHSTYVGQFELPSGYTLVEYGFILTDAFLPDLKLDTTVEASETKVVAPGSNHQTLTKEFVMSFSDATVDPLTTRAYLVVKNPSNTEEIYYCEEGLMIFAAYGGGGNSGVYYRWDYAVLWNGTNDPINLSGYSLQYSAATSNTWATAANKTLLSGNISARGFILIKLASGSNTSAADLPEPYFTGSLTAMQASNIRLALLSTIDTIPNTVSNPSTDSNWKNFVIDLLGSGTSTVFEGTVATAMSNTTALKRSKFKDTNNNLSDYSIVNAIDGHLSYINPS